MNYQTAWEILKAHVQLAQLFGGKPYVSVSQLGRVLAEIEKHIDKGEV